MQTPSSSSGTLGVAVVGLGATTSTLLAGLALIRASEAFRPRWYRCPAGVWTVGYGTREHLIPRETFTPAYIG